ncbi:MAG: phosphoglycerate kinase [Bacteroidetes bacterium GWF2_42_66]|nr:MAG: phosphoglycerate kinase [Bacteroidetes bacterium GWA2_42_15]OFX98522.1 MAG: phosphoglycerate kinase [Bacteroidetes bacterium GWE2_42_39]OFY42904.1 MAG: phosphoglycerate kinase [Bacteroidetes bacterium GWF2_42_66]HBL74362.1 phosphoglycerate kinase [Prolixibacteraceae bacterium]HCR91401.1 phosphoglycerate kinase [Prolixibacteraceae bacterium]
MQTISTYDFAGKKALIRVDFNVPLNDNFEITDDTRIRAAIPTIKKIIEKGGSPIIMSHFGRPKSGPEDKFSMRHLVKHFSNLLGVDVKLAPDCIGEEVKAMAKALKPGEVLLLENLRFHKEEEKGDVEFSRQLAENGDCWVNDAFGTAHRAHASTAVMAQFFPNDKMFGYLIEGEIESLDKVLKNPTRPMTAIMGGAKVSSKITIIENMLDKVDNLIIGGGMTYTFVKANGGKIGNSICEDDYLEMALAIQKKAAEKGVKLYIATDVVAADDFSPEANTQPAPANNIPDGWQGLDAGPETIATFKNVIENSGTILWNGPVGVFEFDKFAVGSRAVAEAIAAATKKGAFSLIGGGDSVACINKFELADQVSYISTAGGALLEYLEGRVLPGVAAVLGE